MRTAGPAATTPRRIMTDLGQARQFGQTMTWLREARCVRAAALTAAMGTPLGRGGCMCGADGYLLAKLVKSYSCALTSGSWRRPWRWPGSSRRVGSQLAGSTRVPAQVRCPCVVRLAGAPSLWTLGSTGLMGEDSRRRGGASGLTDRHAERGVLDQLISTVRAGGSRVLVVHGEPGVGKSALLDYLAGRAAGCRVVRAAGVESEMELAFAGLHQVLAPVLDHLGGLPGPQRDALRTAFGLSAGPVPDRFLVGLAVLGLVSEAAAERPLICVVDDEQWLDRASAQALGFVARRLAAEPVGLVFAAAAPSAELAGLPELVVAGLREEDARELLDAVLAGPVDTRVRDLIVAETRGNPLALLELPRGLSPAELAGGFGLPAAVSLPGRIEESFLRQLDGLPADTRQLLQLAAADPSGDPLLVWRAATALGIGVHAAMPAIEAGLVEFGTRVRFRHPLARSAAYRSAPVQQVQQMHAALAEVTDPAADPDRRAWHRAQAAPGPDEDVAAELGRSAGRAQGRGGLAAAAAFLERAALLTPEPGRRARRLLAAARAKREAGELDTALGLLVATEAGPLDALQAAQVESLRGQIAADQNRGSDAARLLLRAARLLEPLDAALARDTHLEAIRAAMAAGDLAGGVREAAPAARAAPPGPDPPRAVDVLLDAFALRFTEGYAAAAPTLTRAFDLLVNLDVGAGEARGWLWLASGRASTMIATELWDFDSWHALAARQVQVARDMGALVQLQFALRNLSMHQVLAGELDAAARRRSPDRGGDRPPTGYVRSTDARRLAGPRAGGIRADPGHRAGGDRTRDGQAGRDGGLGERGTGQQPGPVRRCAGRRPQGLRARPSVARPSDHA